MCIRLALAIAICSATVFADPVPIPGSQPVKPVYDKADLVCFCRVTDVSYPTLQTNRRTATLSILTAFKQSGQETEPIILQLDEPVRFGVAYPTVTKGETALLFLSNKDGQYQFTDRFVGAIPFKTLMPPPEEQGFQQLEGALVAAAVGSQSDDAASALLLLQGVDTPSPETIARLRPLTLSGNPETALGAFVVVLRGLSLDDLRSVTDYLRTHPAGPAAFARGRISQELERFSTPDAIPMLSDLSGPDFPMVRQGAVRALAKIRDPRTIPVLLKRLDDGDDVTKYLAISALSQTLGKRGEYAPSMREFDQRPDYFIGLWKHSLADKQTQ